MFRSKEIRWFKDYTDPAIEDWFVRHGQTFETASPRTDFYLPTGKDDITVKLREGNIEIKQREGTPQPGTLTAATEGIYEDWVKWSFNAGKDDRLSNEITGANNYDWIETIKTRIGVKLTRDTFGKLQVLPIKTFVDSGCQIEYTHVIASGKTYYTFALEWFGEKDMEIGEALLAEILGDVILNREDSMGYGEFLKMKE